MAGRYYASWRAALHAALLSTILALPAVLGVEDLYSNSYISPNSKQEHGLEPSVHRATYTSAPEALSSVSMETLFSEQYGGESTETERVIRSVDHTLSPSAQDYHLPYKNVEESLDSNDVELSGRIGQLIQPSKTEPEFESSIKATPAITTSGEAQGAPQPRHLQEPPSANTTPSASPSQPQATPRQANSDIQDIITGIVKLLNGNVNVQANTAPVLSRPLRPLSTRINNRGPPRITDVPALPPDFDQPAPLPPPSSKLPTPYPFDMPSRYDISQRPLFRPPTSPPWNRRRPPVPPRRPIPPYKPLPPITFTEANEDVLTLDLGEQLQALKPEPNSTEAPSTSDLEDVHFELNKEKTLSKKVSSSTKLDQSETITSTVSTVTSSSVQSTSTALPEGLNSTSLIGQSSASLQSSESVDLETSTVPSSVPTEPLAPSTTTSTVSTTESAPSILPSSVPQVLNSTTNSSSATKQDLPYFSYRPRPGIVLDDTEYKPGGLRPTITQRPLGQIGDIFDVTVSAIQGPKGGQGKPYVIPVDIENVQGQDVITSPVGTEGFVSIDGKRTYLNLFEQSSEIKPSPTVGSSTATGTGFAVVESKPSPSSKVSRRPFRPKPSQVPVRIDTCIVGDDSTCDASQHEICKTELGVSACHCRPGTARRKHRDPCRKIVSVVLSLRVDKLYERRVVWANELADKDSESYQQLSYEAERALESAMSMTPFSDEYLGAKVNSIYRGERAAGQAGVFVNLTLQLEENADTSRPAVRADIQKHLLGVIQRRSNNVGHSALWVDSPPGSISNLQDLDECSSPELHDCHSLAKCVNVFGSFKCECNKGYKDPWADNRHRAGRICEQCSPQFCNNRGECKYENGQETCVCTGNYYGNQCELDGEVLGVAIGASVAAVIIIGLTLVCLVMWSRRWSREQKAAVGSPVFGYMATASNTVKTPVVGAPPYQLTLEDRLRWAQIADVMAQANHYAPEPVQAPTRPGSAMFGYTLSNMGTLPQGSMHGTLPPIPLPRLNLHAQMAGRAASMHGMRPLDNSSSSEEEDKADLLGRNFQVPRPKSRSNASIANQSGIYYDVDYDQNEIYKPAGGIPLSTYSMGRPQYFRN